MLTDLRYFSDIVLQVFLLCPSLSPSHVLANQFTVVVVVRLDHHQCFNQKEEVDNLDMKYIINNLIKNGDVKLGNVPRFVGNQRLTHGFK